MPNLNQHQDKNEIDAAEGFHDKLSDKSRSSLSRRRLIRLGSATVPIAATLVSRPVLAWHCNSTSAWGSEQINPNQSTVARNNIKQLADESWTIGNWVNNSSGSMAAPPWTTLGLQTTKSWKDDYYKKYTLAQLYSASGGIPSGLAGTDGVWEKINSATPIQKYLIVARLNANLIANVGTCLKSGSVDQLPLMSSGTYSPANLPNTVWQSSDIISYLDSNYIVKP